MQLYEMVNGPPLPRVPPRETPRQWEDASDTPTDTLVIETLFKPAHGGEVGQLACRQVDFQSTDPRKVQAVSELVAGRQKQLAEEFRVFSPDQMVAEADRVIANSWATIQRAKEKLMAALYEFVRVSEANKAAINYVTGLKDAH
jgi:hypothetical protein